MAARIRRIEYFYTTVRDEPGEGFRLLSRLASAEVALLAFNSIPVGPAYTQLVLFPERADILTGMAAENGLDLTGPQHAILIQGDDELGALVRIHETLSKESINIFKSEGVADGKGGFGYILHVRPADFERAAEVLKAE